MPYNPDGSPTYFTDISQGTYNHCLSVVKNAQAAWTLMVAEFAAENIAKGITQAGKTLLIGEALNDVAKYGSQGSLWQAYNALSEVKITPEMAPYLTADRIQWMKNKMISVISQL
jgi:hypothetical protein